MGELESGNQEPVKKWLNSPKMENLRHAWQQSEMITKAEDQAWWDSLSMEERARAFRQTMRLMFKAEVEDRGTYRHAIYSVFNVDYMDGMSCNYMALHNLIYQGLATGNPDVG